MAVAQGKDSKPVDTDRKKQGLKYEVLEERFR